MAWHDRITWPWRALSDMQADVAALRLAVLAIPARLTRLERIVTAAAEDLAARIDAAEADTPPDDPPPAA